MSWNFLKLLRRFEELNVEDIHELLGTIYRTCQYNEPVPESHFDLTVI